MVEVLKLPSGKFTKPCPKCFKSQTYLRKNYAEKSLKEGKVCRTCSNKNPLHNSNLGLHRGVRVSWFNKFKTGALLRGLTWSLTLDNVADVLEQQDGLCALTRWPIHFPTSGHPQACDASIDRIDSQDGYKIENVQLVNKKVNMMKQGYSQEDFIEVCKAVADKAKW